MTSRSCDVTASRCCSWSTAILRMSTCCLRSCRSCSSSTSCSDTPVIRTTRHTHDSYSTPWTLRLIHTKSRRWQQAIRPKYKGKGCHSVPGAYAGCSSPWLRSLRSIYHRLCDAWPVRRQTYGYLPNRKAMSLLLAGTHFISRWG